MVKFDDDPVRPSVYYKTSLGWELPAILLCVIVLIALAQGVRTNLVDGQWLQALGLIGFAIFVFIAFFWYWREWRGRTTIMMIAEGQLRIEERKRNVVSFQKSLDVNQIQSVYCKYRIGRSTDYEVWAKRAIPNDLFLVSTGYDKAEAIAIRHFLAMHLHVPEIEQPSKSLLPSF